MAKRCDICGKEPVFGHNVSHSQRKTNRRWTPNLRKMRVTTNGTPQNITICTSCLKSGKTAPAV